MARKRFIAPEFFTHRALYRAEKQYRLPLRVAFAGLWTQADRRGIFRWDPDALQLAILPYDRCEMTAVLDALHVTGFVRKYQVDGRAYGMVPSFATWQHFHKNEKASNAPEPSNGWLEPSTFGLSTPVAVAVTTTTAVDTVSSTPDKELSTPADGGLGSEAPAPSALSLVKDTAEAMTTRGKRLPAPPPPGMHGVIEA